MMTGVARAIQLRDGSIELTYADTTTESAECGDGLVDQVGVSDEDDREERDEAEENVAPA